MIDDRLIGVAAAAQCGAQVVPVHHQHPFLRVRRIVAEGGSQARLGLVDIVPGHIAAPEITANATSDPRPDQRRRCPERGVAIEHLHPAG